jgi:hypothetical protein
MTTNNDKLVDDFKPVANEMERSIKAKCPNLNREERLLIMAMSLWAGAKQLAAENASLTEQLKGAGRVDRALEDHQIALIVNQLRDTAIDYHSTQQLRDRIAHIIVPYLRKEKV